MSSLSEPFIRRPVGTTLLAIGLFLVGAVAYNFLPVASIPSVDFPSIRVSASRPGADPTIMSSTVAAPLERRLGEIAGIDQITSTSSLGTTSISLQFAIGRNIDRAARDVQAAINASLADLPTDLPTLPNFRKANPAAAPVLIIALTSKTMLPGAIYDVADTVIAQRISQVPGVALFHTYFCSPGPPGSAICSRIIFWFRRNASPAPSNEARSLSCLTSMSRFNRDSIDPKRNKSSVAVLGPTPGTPGMLSTASPMSDSQSTINSGPTPVLARTSSAVQIFSDLSLGLSNPTRGFTSCMKSLSELAMTVSQPLPSARTA